MKYLLRKLSDNPAPLFGAVIFGNMIGRAIRDLLWS